MNPLLEVDAVWVRFGGLWALRDVSFTVEAGAVLGLIGPNGAGKTTLFNVASGFLAPTQGRVRLDGRDLAGRRPDEIVRLGLVRTFQNVRMFRHRTVLENVMIGAHTQGHAGLVAAALRLPDVVREERSLRARALDMLAFVGLEGRAEDRSDALPAGQQRLLEVARALAAGPRLLMLDEPAAGLNETETGALVGLLKTLKQQGLTIVVVEHHLGLVMEVSDTVVVLAEGQKLAEGLPAAVRSDPAVIRAYIGEPAPAPVATPA